MGDNFLDELDLNFLLDSFYKNKEKLDTYKKKADEENRKIKELMFKLNKEEFESDSGLIAKLSTQKRESFKEDMLISKLKELGITTPIKTIEVIDYDSLENVIYNGQLDASILTEFKEVKEVVTLKVSEKKSKV